MVGVFVCSCAIPVLFVFLPLGAFLLSRSFRFIAAQEKSIMEHLAFSVVIQIPVTSTHKTPAILTCSMPLQMMQLQCVVRVFVLLTSAVVLVDLQFDLWPCIAYSIAIPILSIAIRGSNPMSLIATTRCHLQKQSGCHLQRDPGDNTVEPN